MKRVLHIPNFYPPHTGGIEEVCYNIVQILKKDCSLEQKVICFSGIKQTIVDIHEDVEITRVGSIKKVASQFISLTYRAELKKMIQSFKPDVIHYHAPNPLVAMFLLSVIPTTTKLIVHWHSDIVAQKYLYVLVKPIETKLLSRADTVIATSPNYIEKSMPLLRFIDKVQVIQNVINVDTFKDTEWLQYSVADLQNRFAGKPILFFVGRHVSYKGLQYLIDAEPYITKDCVIVIGGVGKLTNSLRLKNKSSRIHFMGRIPDKDLTTYFYASSIFVFPSVTKNEAFGMALAEAMYCYSPAITFQIEGSGVNWVNKHNETGLEVQNGNSKELARAIDMLLSDKILLENYARNARARIESHFTPNNIVDKILKIYK